MRRPAPAIRLTIRALARFWASTAALAALMTIALGAAPGLAQPGAPGGQMLPPGGFHLPPPPPVKPYKPVAVTPPAPISDPNFLAFRKQLDDTAKRQDRAALAKLVVVQGFFWMQDKDLADKNKSGIDNLAKAIDLDAKDGSGWELLGAYANEATAQEIPGRSGTFCAPGGPTFDAKEIEALANATQTEPADWIYPNRDGVEVHAAAQPDSPVIDKLGLFLVRMVPDTAPPQDASAPPLLHVALPSGKSGFVAIDSMLPFVQDQICYSKDAGGWKITGYVGGISQ